MKGIIHPLAALFVFLVVIFQASAQNTSTTLKSIEAGKVVYTEYCATCHQVDGGGVPNMNPTLSQTSFIKGDKMVLAGIVLKGMSKQEIDGETYHNVMPSFDYLTDAQIADVLTYVRNSFGNKESVVGEADVRSSRAGVKK